MLKHRLSYKIARAGIEHFLADGNDGRRLVKCGGMIKRLRFRYIVWHWARCMVKARKACGHPVSYADAKKVVMYIMLSD
jgi:hypothetical protein